MFILDVESETVGRFTAEYMLLLGVEG
jgi:hypothetical protein